GSAMAAIVRAAVAGYRLFAEGAAVIGMTTPSRLSARWNFSRAFDTRHFTVARVTSSVSAISVYERPTTSRRRSAILRSGLSASTALQTASIVSARSAGGWRTA